MPDARTLYQRLLLDHNRNPRNAGALAHPTHAADGSNPMCGDHITLHLQLRGTEIVDIRFHSRGCAVARASASMMTERVKGQSPTAARALAAQLEALLTAPEAAPVPDLGDLTALVGVRGFPMRVKCALLAWETLIRALA